MHCFFTDGETVSDTVLPYQSELGLNPSMSEMSQHVIKEKRRPVFPAALQVADKVCFNDHNPFKLTRKDFATFASVHFDFHSISKRLVI